MPNEPPQQVLDYLGDQNTITLATASSDGKPHASTFMYANDGLVIYFWARPTSATAEHLEVNRRVSFAIDEYVPDWTKAKGIQGEGECARIDDGDELARVIALLGDKFPSPRSTASTVNIAFFKILPSEIQYIDNAGTDIQLRGDDFGVDFHREKVL